MRRFWVWLLVALTLASATAAPAQIVGGVPLPLLQGPSGCNQSATLELDFNTNLFCQNGQKFGSAAAAIPGFSYSRTGTEYSQTSSRLLVPFGSGVPAVTDLGLQVWEARTNLLLQSQDFSNASWTATGLASVNATATTAPDGTATGNKLIEDTSNGAHRVLASATKAASALTYTQSAYFKAAERSQLRLSFDDGGSNGASAIFDASSGTISTAAAVTGTFTSASATITAVASGWFRATLTATTNTGTTIRYAFSLSLAGSASYQGVASDGLYLWGAQLEQAAFAGPYIPTTSASATRGAASASVGGLSVNAGDYTIAAQFVVPPNVANFPTVLTLNDGSASNVMALYIDNTGQLSAAETVGGVSKFNVAYGAVVAGTTIRVAVSRAGGTVKMSVNGAAETTISSAYVSAALNKLLIGVNSTGIGQLNSTLGRGVLYPAAMNTQALTA